MEQKGSLLSVKAVVQRLNYLEQSHCAQPLGEVFTVFRYVTFNEILQGNLKTGITLKIKVTNN